LQNNYNEYGKAKKATVVTYDAARQAMYVLTILRRVRMAMVAVEKQYIF